RPVRARPGRASRDPRCARSRRCIARRLAHARAYRGGPPGHSRRARGGPRVMPRLDATASGVFVIAPTPFRSDGALALDDVPRMVEFFLARGADGLTLLGMMGEATKLTEAESRA